MSDWQNVPLSTVVVIWLALAAAWVLFLMPVLALRRRVDRHVWPAWRVTLRGEAAAHFAYLRDLFEGNAELLRDMLAVAARHGERGAAEMARTRLGQFFYMVADFVERARVRLDEWLVVCRAAHALYPLPPLPRGVFRLWLLRVLALMHGVAYAIAVTSGERFRLRLRVLDWSFKLLAWTARRAGGRLDRRTAGAVAHRDWSTAGAVAHDFHVVSSETVGSARGLLAVESTFGQRGP